MLILSGSNDGFSQNNLATLLWRRNSLRQNRFRWYA